METHVKDREEDLNYAGKMTVLEDMKSMNLHNGRNVAQNREGWKTN